MIDTHGTRDGTLVRVRHTGKPLYMPTDFRVVAGGIELTFSQPLGRETAEDVGSYGIEQWNYLWGEQYGSPEYSVTDPSKDTVSPLGSVQVPREVTVVPASSEVCSATSQAHDQVPCASISSAVRWQAAPSSSSSRSSTGAPSWARTTCTRS